MIVICHIYEKAEDLLPHFLKHYSELGADQFIFGIYGGKSNPVWNIVESIGKSYPITLHHYGDMELIPALESDFKNIIRQQLSPSEWYIPTDLDEFHKVEGYNNFHDLKKDCESENAEYVLSSFMDRITLDGSVPSKIDPDRSIWEQFPRNCRISDTILKAYCNKLCMVKQNVPVSGGHHDAGSEYKKFSKMGRTYHFKWFGNVYEREKLKLGFNRKQKRTWQEEQARIIDFMDAHDGKVCT